MGEVKDLADQLSLEDQTFINSLEDVTVSSKELNQHENNIIAQLKTEFSLFKVMYLLINEVENFKIVKRQAAALSLYTYT